jgi:hypothetical protein
VPIECDGEYGRSWDVEHHLTGDDSHAPAAWTEIAGMENYIPDEFDIDSIKAMLKAIRSGEEAKINKVRNFLFHELHPRAHEAAELVFKVGLDEKKKALFAALQLSEYWKIDETPDDVLDMETLEQYEARCGLTAADRGQMPPEGFLGAVPLTSQVKRPPLPSLDAFDDLLEKADELVASQTALFPPTMSEIIERQLEAAEARVEELHKELAAEEVAAEDVFHEEPRAKPKPTPPVEVKIVIPVDPEHEGLPRLKSDLSPDEATALKEYLGCGNITMKMVYRGRILTARGVARRTLIPEFSEQ